jgi:hypothetical protein
MVMRKGESMKQAGMTGAVLVALGVALSANALAADAAHGHEGLQPASAAAGDGTEKQWQFFDDYCSKCHNSTDWAGGVAFDTMVPENLADDAAVWEKCAQPRAAHSLWTNRSPTGGSMRRWRG